MATDFSRKNSATLDEDIEFRGDTILAGSSVTAELGFTIIEAAYEYALKHTEHLELALSAGLHYTSVDAGLTYNVLTPGSEVSDSVGNSASADLPLPVFGGRALWLIGGDFHLDTMVQWLALSIDELDVDKDSFKGSLDWTYEGPQIFYNVSF